MAGEATEPAPRLWWELGKEDEGRILVNAFRDWETAKRGLENAHESMRQTEYQGEMVRDSYAWRMAGSLTNSEYTRWEKAGLAYMAAVATPHLLAEHREVLGYINQVLRPYMRRTPKGKRKTKAA